MTVTNNVGTNASDAAQLIVLQSRSDVPAFGLGGTLGSPTGDSANAVFIDDAGDDTYADLPAKANANNYHGGHSFALFVDRAGNDTYRGKDSAKWNGRVFWRHDGAYVFDLIPGTPFDDLRSGPAKPKQD